MENSQNTIFVYDKYKCKWNKDIINQQTNHQNGSRIFEFTNNSKYLSDIPNSSDGKGILYIYHDAAKSNITIMYFIKRKFQLNDGNKFIPSQFSNIIKDETSYFYHEKNKLDYVEFKQMISSIDWIKNVITKIDENQSEFITIQQFIEKYQDLQYTSVENNSDESDDDVKNSKNSKEKNGKNQKDIEDHKDNINSNNKSNMNANDNLQQVSQQSTSSSTISMNNNNQNNSKLENKENDSELHTVSKPITSSNKNNNNNNNESNKLENKPEKTPTSNTNTNKSKFLGNNSHKSLTNNHNNKSRLKSKTTQDQLTIMEAMGARYQKMVSSFNTNNIHNQSQLPPVLECKSECRTIDMYYSDTYGFTKFKFFNPIIKEFNIDLISNFAKHYKSKIHHQHNDY